jgi:pilus assembly protein Flp/PilA
LRRLISKFLSDQSGSAAIEYGLIAAGIALTIIGAVNGAGSVLKSDFNSTGASLR